MRDFNSQLSLDNNDRMAAGSVKVDDYTLLVGVKAAVDITVDDYTEFLGVKATGTITITDYTALLLKTVTVNGGAKVAGTDWTAGTSNNATATSLASALDAISGVTATAVGAVVTVVADLEGLAGNLIAISTDATSGITIPEAHLLGGKEQGTVTVGADVLVQGTDFSAATSNAVTAENIKVAVHALTDYNATRSTATVLVVAAVVGEAWNVDVSVSPSAAATLSSDTLVGGVDEGVVSFGATDLTQGSDFDALTSNAATATSLASALDGISGYTATVDGEDDTLINIVADTAGDAGNELISTNADGSLTITTMAGGADYFYSDTLETGLDDNSAVTMKLEVLTLTGNAFGSGTATIVDYTSLAGKTVTVGASVLTEGVDWDAVTSNNATATDLAAAINALPLVNAVAVGAVITITAAAAGLAGNLALATNGAAALTVSGATLTGGADAKVNGFVDVSSDKDDWDMIYEFDTLTSASERMATLTEILNYARLRIEVLNATATVKVTGLGSNFSGDGEQVDAVIEGSFTVPASLPAALSDDSINFKYIDIQASVDNVADITLGALVLSPGASKRYTKGNLKNINVTVGTANDVITWDGERV